MIIFIKIFVNVCKFSLEINYIFHRILVSFRNKHLGFSANQSKLILDENNKHQIIIFMAN